MKAFLVYHGQTPRKPHDLVFPLTECRDIELGLEDLRDDREALSTHAVDVRYPDVRTPDADEGRAMTDTAHRIRRRVLDALPDTD